MISPSPCIVDRNDQRSSEKYWKSQNASAEPFIVSDSRITWLPRSSTMRSKPVQTAFSRMDMAVRGTRSHVAKRRNHMISIHGWCNHAYFAIATVLENFDVRRRRAGRMQLKHLKPLLNPQVKYKAVRFPDFKIRSLNLY